MLKGAAVVIFDREGRLLLLLRPGRATWMPHKWAFPGGHIDEGERPIEAAVREVKEETTLIITDPTEFYISPNGEVVYFTTRTHIDDVAIGVEHDDFAWVYPEELTNYDVVPGLIKVVQRAKEILNYA